MNSGIWNIRGSGAAGIAKLRVIGSNPVGHAIVESGPQGGPTYPISYRRCSAREQLRTYRVAFTFRLASRRGGRGCASRLVSGADAASEPGDLCHLIVFVLVLILTNGCGTVVVPVGVMLG
jgi:hypothetical protein